MTDISTQCARATCSRCGKPCTPVHMDFGYGWTEYWGHGAAHHDWRTASDCCEAEVAPLPEPELMEEAS